METHLPNKFLDAHQKQTGRTSGLISWNAVLVIVKCLTKVCHQSGSVNCLTRLWCHLPQNAREPIMFHLHPF